MGNIRPDYIKRMVLKFVQENPGEFTGDFEVNKKKLQEMNVIPSKTLRNKVAGYMATYVKKLEAAEAR